MKKAPEFHYDCRFYSPDHKKAEQVFTILSVLFVLFLCSLALYDYKVEGYITSAALVSICISLILFGSFVYFVIFMTPIRIGISISSDILYTQTDTLLGCRKLEIPLEQIVQLRLRHDLLFPEYLKISIFSEDQPQKGKNLISVRSDWGRTSFIALAKKLHEKLLEEVISKKSLTDKEHNIFLPLVSNEDFCLLLEDILIDSGNLG